MKILFIMDPLHTVKPYKDTSYFIMLGAIERGHEVYFCQFEDLVLESDKVYASPDRMQVFPYHEGHTYKDVFQSLSKNRICLDEMNAIFIRKDPPFDRKYLYGSLILEHVSKKVLILNRPEALRSYNEKLATHFFSEFMAPTVVTARTDEILQFVKRKATRYTLKPLDGFGGRGISFIESDDKDLKSKVEFLNQHGSHYIIAQEYIPEAKEGDKRILLLNGEVLGAVLRKHADGKELNNLDAGGTALPTTLTAHEKKVCALLKPFLQEQGIYFAGVDFLGDYLTEINITSPTCLQELSRFENTAYHHQIIEWVEKNLPV